jgi:hypothetical protein
MRPNHGNPRSLRNPRAFHESVENMIEQKKRTNHIQTRIDEKLDVRNAEKFIIARVTNGNSTFGNSDAIENIHGNIPTKRTIIATKATINNTTGYVTAQINLFLNIYKKAYSEARLRNTVTKFHDDSHDFIIAISEALK